MIKKQTVKITKKGKDFTNFNEMDHQHKTSDTLKVKRNHPKSDDMPNIGITYPEVPEIYSNVEAERGELLLKAKNGNLFNIGGKKHSQGGTKIMAEEGDFIFSDKVKLKGEFLKTEFNLKPDKEYTVAEIAKKYLDMNKYHELSKSEDPLEKKTANSMIAKFHDKLSKLQMFQEMKKGFPQGMPNEGMGQMPGGDYAMGGQYLPMFPKGGFVPPDGSKYSKKQWNEFVQSTGFTGTSYKEFENFLANDPQYNKVLNLISKSNERRMSYNSGQDLLEVNGQRYIDYKQKVATPFDDVKEAIESINKSGYNSPYLRKITGANPTKINISGSNQDELKPIDVNYPILTNNKNRMLESSNEDSTQRGQITMNSKGIPVDNSIPNTLDGTSLINYSLNSKPKGSDPYEQFDMSTGQVVPTNQYEEKWNLQSKGLAGSPQNNALPNILKTLQNPNMNLSEAEASQNSIYQDPTSSPGPLIAYTGAGKKNTSKYSTEQWNGFAKKLGFTGKNNKEFQQFLKKKEKYSKLIDDAHSKDKGLGPNNAGVYDDGILGARYDVIGDALDKEWVNKGIFDPTKIGPQSFENVAGNDKGPGLPGQQTGKTSTYRDLGYSTAENLALANSLYSMFNMPVNEPTRLENYGLQQAMGIQANAMPYNYQSVINEANKSGRMLARSNEAFSPNASIASARNSQIAGTLSEQTSKIKGEEYNANAQLFNQTKQQVAQTMAAIGADKEQQAGVYNDKVVQLKENLWGNKLAARRSFVTEFGGAEKNKGLRNALDYYMQSINPQYPMQNADLAFGYSAMENPFSAINSTMSSKQSGEIDLASLSTIRRQLDATPFLTDSDKNAYVRKLLRIGVTQPE